MTIRFIDSHGGTTFHVSGTDREALLQMASLRSTTIAVILHDAIVMWSAQNMPLSQHRKLFSNDTKEPK